MIIILFISLAFVFFIHQYFEHRRDKRNENFHEKKRDAYMNLLESLRKKKEMNDNKE